MSAWHVKWHQFVVVQDGARGGGADLSGGFVLGFEGNVPGFSPLGVCTFFAWHRSCDGPLHGFAGQSWAGMRG